MVSILHSGGSLQTGSPYGFFCFRIARREESLQWSLYNLSIYVQILNINCWLANSQFPSSSKPLHQSEAWCTTTHITSSNQRLWECIWRHLNFYTDTLSDFPSWLSTSKNQPFFINNRSFTERYFSDKVHAILIEEVPLQTMLRDGLMVPVSVDLQVFEIGLKYLHQPLNFVLNILKLPCNV